MSRCHGGLYTTVLFVLVIIVKPEKLLDHPRKRRIKKKIRKKAQLRATTLHFCVVFYVVPYFVVFALELVL